MSGEFNHRVHKGLKCLYFLLLFVHLITALGMMKVIDEKGLNYMKESILADSVQASYSNRLYFHVATIIQSYIPICLIYLYTCVIY